MARIKHEKAVTGFHVYLKPSEYRILMEALSEYHDNLINDRNELLRYEENTEYEDEYINEVAELLKTLEDGLDGQTVIG
jgi:hypothetical protein